MDLFHLLALFHLVHLLALFHLLHLLALLAHFGSPGCLHKVEVMAESRHLYVIVPIVSNYVRYRMITMGGLEW